MKEKSLSENGETGNPIFYWFIWIVVLRGFAGTVRVKQSKINKKVVCLLGDVSSQQNPYHAAMRPGLD